MKTRDWINALPGQFNLWNIASGLIAYSTITPLYYQGLIAGSEFLTYNAGKLYIAMDLTVSSTNNPVVALISLSWNDMADVVTFVAFNAQPVWDTNAVALKYIVNDISYKNIWFSRIVSSYTRIVFNGYRLNV